MRLAAFYGSGSRVEDVIDVADLDLGKESPWQVAERRPLRRGVVRLRLRLHVLLVVEGSYPDELVLRSVCPGADDLDSVLLVERRQMLVEEPVGQFQVLSLRRRPYRPAWLESS